MSPIWNHAWKDLVRFRFYFAAWTLLIVARQVFFSASAGVWGAANFAVLGYLQDGFGEALALGLEPLVASFLVASLIYEDPPAGKDPFWLTRPLSGGQLLAAKLAVAGAVLVLWPVLLNFPWWIACGFSLSGIAAAAGNLLLIYGAVVLVGAAVAAATDSYPRYILWTFAGLASVAIVLVVAVLLREPKTGATPAGPALAGFNAILLLAILLALQIVGHRFFIRYFRRGLVLGLIGTLLAGAWIVSSPAAARAAARFQSAESANPADDDIRLTVAGPMRVEDLRQTRAAVLAVPVRIENLPAGTLGFLRIEGTWKSAEGKTWSNRGTNSFGEFMPTVARQLLQLPLAQSDPRVAAARFTFGARAADAMTYAQRIAAEAVSFQGAATLQLADGRLRELPLREQVTRIDGDSVSLTRLERRDDRVAFTLTTRSPLDRRSWATSLGYLALFNRRTGELIEPGVGARTGRSLALLNGVLVTESPVSFKVPPVAGWLDEARLVFIGFEHGRTIVRGIASDPLMTATAASEKLAERKSIELPAEVLQRYVGTYILEGKAPVSIALENGHLVARGAGIPDTVLSPESEVRFRALGAEAAVEFRRDGQGVVTHAILHDRGGDRVAVRTP
jgi:hypothetical protein